MKCIRPLSYGAPGAAGDGRHYADVLPGGGVLRSLVYVSRLAELRRSFLSVRGASRRQSFVHPFCTEVLEAAGIVGYGARHANCGWVLGFFSHLSLCSRPLPLRPKDPCAGDFGYRHETLSIRGEGVWLVCPRRTARSRRRTGRLPFLI